MHSASAAFNHHRLPVPPPQARFHVLQGSSHNGRSKKEVQAKGCALKCRPWSPQCGHKANTVGPLLALPRSVVKLCECNSCWYSSAEDLKGVCTYRQHQGGNAHAQHICPARQSAAQTRHVHLLRRCVSVSMHARVCSLGSCTMYTQSSHVGSVGVQKVYVSVQVGCSLVWGERKQVQRIPNG